MNQQQTGTYQQIEAVIALIGEHFRDQPGLDQMAAVAGLSRFHLERLFMEWAGITPGQFVRFLTLEYARKQLIHSRSLLKTASRAGLSGPGRPHNLSITFEAMTAGESRQQGKGIHIRSSLAPCPFGTCLLARTERGICHLSFWDDDERERSRHELQSRWPEAILIEDDKTGQQLIETIFATDKTGPDRPLHLLLRGSNFQIQVWQALLSLPPATLISYQDLAYLLGRPSSVRAVAGAVARNPIAWLIPCHRVIKKSGQIHNYRWGPLRKRAMLIWEGTQA